MNTIRKLIAGALSASILMSAMPAFAHDRDDRRHDVRSYSQDRWNQGRHRGWEARPAVVERRVVRQPVVVQRPVYVEQRRDDSDTAAGILIGGIIGAIIGSQIMGR